MRKFYYFLMIAVAAVGLSACSSDDDEPSLAGNEPSGVEDTSTQLSPNYVDVDWTKTQLYECQPDEGNFSFSLNDQTEKIVPGSVMAIDADTMGYLVTVTAVRHQGNKVVIAGERGSLDEVIANSDYELVADDSQARKAPANSVSTDGFRRVYSSETLVLDDEGQWQNLTAAATSARKASTISKNLGSWKYSIDNKTLFSSSHAKVYLKEANISASLDVVIKLSFGSVSKVKTFAQAYDQFKSKNLAVTGEVKGNVSTNLVVRAEASGKGSISKKDALWKSDLFKPIRKKFMVPVGSVVVPVWVTFSADLYRGADLSASGEASFQTGIHSKVNGTVGFTWKQSGGISPIRTFSMTNTPVYPTIEGKGTVTGNVRVFPRIRVSLYDVVGPSFDIKPYARFTLNGGFKQQYLAASVNNYCAWDLDAYAGLKANAGLSISWLNKEKKRYATSDKQIVEKKIYSSPTGIKYSSASNKKAKGVKTKVTFAVYDQLLGNSIASPLPQLVKFKATGGKLSASYGLVKKGKVSVSWTPSSASSKLTATLYNASGKAIKSATW